MNKKQRNELNEFIEGLIKLITFLIYALITGVVFSLSIFALLGISIAGLLPMPSFFMASGLLFCIYFILMFAVGFMIFRKEKKK